MEQGWIVLVIDTIAGIRDERAYGPMTESEASQVADRLRTMRLGDTDREIRVIRLVMPWTRQ
jgi:hypothetical protein